MSWGWVLPQQSQQQNAAVAAYFTLAGSTVLRADLPKTASSLPAYPVPVVILARLGVSLTHQRQQLGAKTLVQALRTARDLSERGLPAFGVILDVPDDDALQFYKRMGMFTPLTEQPKRLFIAMETLRCL